MPARPQDLSDVDLEKVRCDLHNRQGLKHYYDTIVFSSFNSMPKRKAHNHLVSGILFKNKIISKISRKTYGRYNERTSRYNRS